MSRSRILSQQVRMMSRSALNSIPTTQRAFVLPALGSALKFKNDHPVVAPADLQPGQCLVNLTHSGVCHSDFAIKEGWFAPDIPVKDNLVGGHEGIGKIVAIGEHTKNSPVKIGDRVGINFLLDSCRNCEHCLAGEESYCEQSPKSGSTADGTFCEYTVVATDFAIPIPDALTSEEAAPLMCAGYTCYNGILKSNPHVGDWCVIPGAGGGLGHLAVQYAAIMGLRVVAVDTGDEKRKLVQGLGAEKWIDYNESKDVVADIIAATGGGAHSAVVIAGSQKAFDQAVGYVRNRGTVVIVGLPKGGMFSVPTVTLAARGINVRGILIGNRQSQKECVELAAIGKVKVHYTVRGLSELEDVYRDLEQGKVAGRIVLDISK